MAAMKVVKREVSTVYPEEPCEPHVMAMSGADHIVRPRHIPLLLFYAARQDGSQVTQKKQTTLSTLNPTCQFNLRGDSMNLLSLFMLSISCASSNTTFSYSLQQISPYLQVLVFVGQRGWSLPQCNMVSPMICIRLLA